MSERQVLEIIYLEDAYRGDERAYLFLKANWAVIGALLMMLSFVVLPPYGIYFQ